MRQDDLIGGNFRALSGRVHGTLSSLRHVSPKAHRIVGLARADAFILRSAATKGYRQEEEYLIPRCLQRGNQPTATRAVVCS